MDTDSAYMALTGELESLVREEEKLNFYTEYGEWFPRPYCEDDHLDFIDTKWHGEEWVMKQCCKDQFLFDRRTPGLFKDEFVGIGALALNPKTYICWQDNLLFKFSSKGINKKLNDLKRECFEEVLRTKAPRMGTNKGFILKDGGMYTYNQIKQGLSYFYAKRRVCEDGVSTMNILA